jgi:hypothetical protein
MSAPTTRLHFYSETLKTDVHFMVVENRLELDRPKMQKAMFTDEEFWQLYQGAHTDTFESSLQLRLMKASWE